MLGKLNEQLFYSSSLNRNRISIGKQIVGFLIIWWAVSLTNSLRLSLSMDNSKYSRNGLRFDMFKPTVLEGGRG